MDNQAPQITQPQTYSMPQKPSKSRPLFTLIAVLLLVTAVGGVYYWQHQKVKDLQSKVTTLNGKVGALTSQSANPKSTVTPNQATSNPSTDDQVLAVVKTWCNANVDPATKQPLVLTVGKAGPAQKQVLYSADKNFAYVNAVCSKDGTTEGSGSAYYLKKVNNSWVFLYRGQMASPDYTAQFNIPSTFN